MKFSILIIVVAGAIFLTGCPKQELSLDKDGKRLAPVVGTTASEIRFINRALYAITPVGENETKTKYAGFVALTTTDLVLGEGRPSSSQDQEVLRIPIKDIEGMTQAGPTFQIVYDGKMITGLPYRWFSDTADMESLYELVDRLQSDSIPGIAYTPIKGFSDRAFVSIGSVVWGGTDARSESYSNDIPGTESGGLFYNGNDVRDSPNFQPFEH